MRCDWLVSGLLTFFDRSGDATDKCKTMSSILMKALLSNCSPECTVLLKGDVVIVDNRLVSLTHLEHRDLQTVPSHILLPQRHRHKNTTGHIREA
jgi:hypothetical protein